MLRTTIAAIATAAALFGAPIAAADSSAMNNADVVAHTEAPKEDGVYRGPNSTFPFATGDNTSTPMTVLTDEDCNVVRGSWDSENGFTPGAGNSVAWTNDGGKTVRSSPYKSGLN